MPRKPTPAQQLGRQISSAREAAGLTQGQAADALHVHRQTWSRWERGEQVPDALLLGQIARLLGVSADRLLGEAAQLPE